MAAIAQGYSFMRPWMVLAVLPLMAGCTDTDWNKLLSFGSSGEEARHSTVAAAASASTPAPVASPSVPSSAAAQPNDFCLGVARQNATTNDFDTATQQKAAVQSYQQCVAIFGN
jgi:hypothetical protein